MVEVNHKMRKYALGLSAVLALALAIGYISTLIFKKTDFQEMYSEISKKGTQFKHEYFNEKVDISEAKYQEYINIAIAKLDEEKMSKPYKFSSVKSFETKDFWEYAGRKESLEEYKKFVQESIENLSKWIGNSKLKIQNIEIEALAPNSKIVTSDMSLNGYVVGDYTAMRIIEFFGKAGKYDFRIPIEYEETGISGETKIEPTMKFDNGWHVTGSKKNPVILATASSPVYVATAPAAEALHHSTFDNLSKWIIVDLNNIWEKLGKPDKFDLNTVYQNVDFHRELNEYYTHIIISKWIRHYDEIKNLGLSENEIKEYEQTTTKPSDIFNSEQIDKMKAFSPSELTEIYFTNPRNLLQ